ncbi:hypothetical protein [Streptomyces mirabilis]|uniref:hypothetical protein n=1 Tax=Streptomyces mirabilis TaxID=68239 RepID=UPI00339DF790
MLKAGAVGAAVAASGGMAPLALAHPAVEAGDRAAVPGLDSRGGTPRQRSSASRNGRIPRHTARRAP